MTKYRSVRLNDKLDGLVSIWVTMMIDKSFNDLFKRAVRGVEKKLVLVDDYCAYNTSGSNTRNLDQEFCKKYSDQEIRDILTSALVPIERTLNPLPLQLDRGLCKIDKQKD